MNDRLLQLIQDCAANYMSMTMGVTEKLVDGSRTIEVDRQKIRWSYLPKLPQAPRFSRCHSFVLLTLSTMLLFADPSPMQSQTRGPQRLVESSQKAAPQPQAAVATAPTPSSLVAIPLPEIADRLNNLDHLLRGINSQLSEEQNQQDPQEDLKVAGRVLTERAEQAEASLRQSPTIEELREMEADWRQQIKKLARQVDPVTQRLTELENHIRQVESEKALWELTRTEHQQMIGTDVVVQRINDALFQIGQTLALARKQRQTSLAIQNLLSRQVSLASDALDKIQAAERRYGSLLLQADRRPLWQVWTAPQTGPSFREQAREALSHGLFQTWELLKRGWPSLLLLALPFLLVSSLAVTLARRIADWQGGRTGHGDASLFYAQPQRVSLVLAMWSLLWLPLVAPAFLGYLVSSLLFITLLLLVPPLFPATFRPLLYLYAGIYALARSWSFFTVVPLLERLTSLVALGALIAATVWVMRPSRLEKLRDVTCVLGLLVRATWLALALLVLALATDLLGYFALSKLLSRGVIRSVLSAITLYVLARSAGALFSLLLRTRWAQSLGSIRFRGEVLYKWIVRFVVSALFVSWVLITLNGFGIEDEILKWLGSILRAKVGIGDVGFTLGDVVAFATVLVVSYALSRTVGFFLQEDVLPRFSLQRGVPNAILVVIHYSLLLAGFLMAMAAVGLDLTHFTVLAGAFGVGIGFGLQNILSNFVSGLILLFERPINLGDIVEINGITGHVRQIGIRASTIQTFQGADVVVPNSNLVSNQFINWTHTDTMRRIDFKMMVARGTDPECVLKLLCDAARMTSNVEKVPSPVALFSGFGEGALNFELRYWVQLKAMPEVESSVALAVVSALRQAGIEVPFPQRELHVKSVPAQVPTRSAQSETIQRR